LFALVQLIFAFPFSAFPAQNIHPDEHPLADAFPAPAWMLGLVAAVVGIGHGLSSMT
jgi:hypothetical protein